MAPRVRAHRPVAARARTRAGPAAGRAALPISLLPISLLPISLLAVSLLAGACGGAGEDGGRAEPGPGPEAPPSADVAALPAAEVPALVLQACHAGLRGMDRLAGRVWLPDGTELEVFARLPDALRVEGPGGAQVLVGPRAERRSGSAAEPLEEAAAARLRALRALVDAAALGPLRRATGCSRTGLHSFRLDQPHGAAWELSLRPDALLVERLAGPDGEVRVTGHLRTARTWIVDRAEVAPLGACRLRFDAVDFAFDEAMFAPAPQPAGKGAAVDTGAGALPDRPLIAVQADGRLLPFRPHEPSEPELQRTRPMRWLLVDDPGDWEQRTAVVREHFATLALGGQEMAGFAGFCRENGRALLVIGFRAADGAAPFDPPGWEVRDVAGQQVLVVFPQGGDVEQRMAAGREQLGAALRERGLSATGPIVAQPFLHLQQEAPTAAQLREATVRVSVTVR